MPFDIEFSGERDTQPRNLLSHFDGRHTLAGFDQSHAMPAVLLQVVTQLLPG